MTASFDNSVRVLVQAYMKDTLQSGNCLACAVGNLVAVSKGLKYIKSEKINDLFFEDESSFAWYSFLSKMRIGYSLDQYRKLSQEANNEIEPLGYTWFDIDRIEAAFERNCTGKDPMYNSLMAVVEVLAEIHGISLEEKEAAKSLFVKA